MIKKIFSALILCFLCLQMASAQTAAPKNFVVKGYHVDLRVQVIKMPALKALVQKLKDNGVNTLIMEWEATYPYEKYPIISNQYAYTKPEIKSFMKFCDSLKLDVIPLQQSFGHVEYILRNWRFAGLREDQKDFSQVCPVEESGNRELFTELFTEMVATHKSKYFHIGGDETYLLGKCEKCQKKVKEEGLSKLYIDHIRMLCDIVKKLGKIPVLWADIALKHPEDIKLLPKETIFIDWNYGWDLNQFGNLDNLLKGGYEVWGAPAVRSSYDNYYLTQWQLHLNNLRDFVPAGRRLGYTGMVITSWSTNGTFNPLFNSGNDILDLYPRGHRYPITGSNMLLAAFFESVNKTEPLKIHDFILRYGKQTFGFTDAQTELMWRSIATCPFEIRQGKVLSPKKPLTIQQVLDSTVLGAKTLRGLKPLRGTKEFAQLQLMTDIRVQYLETYLIENMLNESTFNDAQYAAMGAKLKVILAKSADLDKRFIELNKDTFYLSELEAENKIRSYHIRVLYDRVAKIKSPSLTANNAARRN